MKQSCFFRSLCRVIFCSVFFATQIDISLHALEMTQSRSVKDSIIVDNRILAKVRDQVITVQDIVKKLDMIFYRQFPEYRSSAEARLQFYKTHWRSVVQDSVNRQLALLYAEEKKFEVSRGDTREELEELFGPNVMLNLYNAGLNLYDVEEMLKADIMMRRIIFFFIRSPVLASLTPEIVRSEYEKRLLKSLEEQKGDEEITWRVYTAQGKNGRALSEEEVQSISLELSTKGTNQALEQYIASLDCDITISSPFTSSSTSMNPKIQEDLFSVSESSPTKPFLSSVRGTENQMQWKWYQLLERRSQPHEPVAFADLEAQLREEIAAPQIMEKTDRFFENLSSQYGVHYFLSESQMESFEPFHSQPNR